MLGTLGTEGAELTVARSAATAAPLDGRTVVITGASDGIGAAAARQVAGLGARVLVVGRSPEQGAAPLVALAVRPDPQAVNGAYLHRFKDREWLVAAEARDAQLARRLWERSAELTGLPG